MVDVAVLNLSELSMQLLTINIGDFPERRVTMLYGVVVTIFIQTNAPLSCYNSTSIPETT